MSSPVCMLALSFSTVSSLESVFNFCCCRRCLQAKRFGRCVIFSLLLLTFSNKYFLHLWHFLIFSRFWSTHRESERIHSKYKQFKKLKWKRRRHEKEATSPKKYVHTHMHTCVYFILFYFIHLFFKHNFFSSFSFFSVFSLVLYCDEQHRIISGCVFICVLLSLCWKTLMHLS